MSESSSSTAAFPPTAGAVAPAAQEPLGRHLMTRGEPPLVGRESALAELERCWGEAHLVTVSAPSGVGKTRLLREWTRGLDARLLWTKADREVAPSSFQMFSGPIAVLETELAARPDLASLLVHELGVELPLMQALSGRRERTAGLQRGLLVMLGLILAVVGRDRPTVLVLDDCQWADPLTLAFLEYWADCGESLLVAALFRGDEVDEDHPLRRLRCKSLSLLPLTDPQALQLLLTREPEASPALLESVVRQAQGNPFVLLNLIRAGGRGDDDRARYESLSPPTRASLAMASVLGYRFQAADLLGCLGEPPQLQEAVGEGLVEVEEGGFRFCHDRVRDAVIASLHADQLAELHLRAARYLSSAAASPFQVAFHFQAAGAAREGFEPSVQAAHLAIADHDSATAIFYLRAALAGSEGQPAPVREELITQLGDGNRLLGGYAEALECFTRAFALAGTDLARARLMLRIGDVHFKRGELELARSSVERGLSLLGERLPGLVLPDFLWQGLVQVARTYLRFPRKARQPRAGDLLRVDLYNRLAYIRWFLDGPLPSISAHLRELNLAELYPPSRTLARAQATHAIAMSAFPLWPRALRFGARALQTARALGDAWGEGQAAHFQGAALLGASRLVEARDLLQMAVSKLRRTGDRWEENGARYHLALAHYRLGDLEEAADMARRTHLIGVEIDDRLAAGDNLFTWAKASGGQIPRPCLEQEKAHTVPDIQRASELLGAEALLEIRQGRFDVARDLLRQAIAIYRRRRAQSKYSAPLPCWLTTALRKGAQAQSDEKTRRAWLAESRRSSNQALRLARMYRNNLPHALREQALIYRLEGRPQDAARALEHSLAVSRELGMAAEQAAARRLAQLWGSSEGEVCQRHDWML